VNALAGLIPDPKENSRFPKAAYTAGMTYNQIIGRILKEGAKRHGLV
jgi:D-alanine-D-alanine ligase